MTDGGLVLWMLLCAGLAVLLSWRLPLRMQAPAIAACGALFLAVLSPVSLLLLATGSLATFWLQKRHIRQRGVLPLALALLALSYAFLLWTGQSPGDGIAQRLILPLGAAFYVLRLVHYLLESYKGNLRPHGVDEYLAYHFLPASLPLGPIHRFDDFLRDWRRRRWDAEEASAAYQRLLFGLVKVSVLGTFMLGYKLPLLLPQWLSLANPASVYFSDMVFWLRLYVMFSGFSDVAIAFGALMGLRLQENFNRPFLAANIAEFWQRWHMSLSAWCRDYVYTPVLALSRWPGLALLSSMLVLGLWHALSLHYLLWGVYHGIGMALHRRFREATVSWRQSLSPRAAAVWRVLAVLLTVHFVVFSFRTTELVEHWMRGG